MKMFGRDRKAKEIKYRYSIRDSNLVIEETQQGKVIWEGRPGGKIPETVEPVYGTNDCVVLVNEYFGYDDEKKRNNIIRCDSNGNVLWTAALPITRLDQVDFYNKMGWYENELIGVTWTTYSVTLNIRNGSIIKQALGR